VKTKRLILNLKKKKFARIIENSTQFKIQDNFKNLPVDLAFLETIVEILKSFRLGLLNPNFFQKINYFSKICQT
jgi:hypothetical protein